MEEDKKERRRPGLVMLDDTYGFTVESDCYPFGKVKNGIIQGASYPTSINYLLTLYGKIKLSEITAEKQLDMKQLLEAVNEVKALIKEINDKLEIKK